MAPRIDIAAICGIDAPGRARMMRDLGDAIVSDWGAAAARELGRTAREYRRAIQIAKVTPAGVRIVLTGMLPNILEQGMGPGGVGTEGAYDQRQFVLKPGTRQLRRSKAGRLYVNVPFPWSVDAIRAAGGGAAVKAARALAPSRTRPGARFRPPGSNLVNPEDMEYGTSWGGRLPARPGVDRDPLAGLVRLEKVYSEATRGRPQSQYMTFRTMSEGGEAWMTPGVRARRLAEGVIERIPELWRMFVGR